MCSLLLDTSLFILHMSFIWTAKFQFIIYTMLLSFSCSVRKTLQRTLIDVFIYYYYRRAWGRAPIIFWIRTIFNRHFGRFYILNKNHNWTLLLHEFFFFPFFFARIFFLGIFPCMNFFWFFPHPPITFLMVRPLFANHISNAIEWRLWNLSYLG